MCVQELLQSNKLYKTAAKQTNQRTNQNSGRMVNLQIITSIYSKAKVKVFLGTTGTIGLSAANIKYIQDEQDICVGTNIKTYRIWRKTTGRQSERWYQAQAIALHFDAWRSLNIHLTRFFTGCPWDMNALLKICRTWSRPKLNNSSRNGRRTRKMARIRSFRRSGLSTWWRNSNNIVELNSTRSLHLVKYHSRTCSESKLPFRRSPNWSRINHTAKNIHPWPKCKLHSCARTMH